MATAGFPSLLVPWLGAGGASVFVAPPPLVRRMPIPSGLAGDTQDVLARMLRRLPPSLWDTDPASDTLQRDLYQAFALQMAVWLAQRGIARTMTLLLEAQGVDLDTLLEDYGLRRYLRRPDPYARQVGMHILWHPQGTLYSVARLADLLFDLPHVTLRTGRSHQHVFVAAMHPVTTPYSYWGLVSAEGLWYAVTVDSTVPTISLAPPPGLDLSPGPPTLHWFTVLDELGATWYVTIHGDTLRLEPLQPAGYGTQEPFAVLDGQGNRWLLAARSTDQVLVTELDPGLAGFGAWRLVGHPSGGVVYLSIAAEVPRLTASLPAGSTDQTPGGTPLNWFTVRDQGGAAWYGSVEHDTLVVERTAPGGLGTESDAVLLDTAAQRWVLTVHSGEAALVATAMSPYNAPLVVVAPAVPVLGFQAFQLLDSAAVPWWICVDADTLFLTPALPVGATDVTPAGGPFAWLRVYDLAGTLWYAFPSPLGVMVLDTVTPGGVGTAQPQTLGDVHGTLWHLGVDPAGNLGVSDAPPVDYAGKATAIALKDASGARWFWRVHGQVIEWSAWLWPDTLDQSPWGDLGWLQVANTLGEVRYLAPTPLGDPFATHGPPPSSPWGWQEPLRFLDASGTPWHLTVLPDDRIGITPGFPDDVPLPTAVVPLGEALEAFGHIQAAGSALTILVS